MKARLKNHLDVIRSGRAFHHYAGALRRRGLRWRLKMAGRKGIQFHPVPDVAMVVRTGDDLIARVFQDGVDDAIVATIRARVPKGGVFVDVGANVGLYAVIAATSAGAEGRVHAVEPVPQLAQRIREHARLNGTSQLTVHEQALGAAAGRMSLFLSAEGGDGWASLYPWRWTSSASIDVIVETLDAFAARQGLATIDLLKVDVEGAEFDVLQGAKGLLESGRIRALLIEHNLETQKARGVDFGAIRDLLRAAGYALYTTDASGMTRAVEDLAALPRLCDVLALRHAPPFEVA